MSAKRAKQYRDSQKKFKLLLEEAELENASVNEPWFNEIGEVHYCDVQSSEMMAYEVLPSLSTHENYGKLMFIVNFGNCNKWLQSFM